MLWQSYSMFVHSASFPAAFGCPSLWASVAWGPPLLQTLGHSRWCLAICCPAWITLSVSAAAHMVEGLEKAAHNLWSMWVIVYWHLKNSWQKEKCWVKDNNPRLPSPSFDLYEKSDESDSSFCFPFIRWPPSSLVPLPTAACHWKVLFPQACHWCPVLERFTSNIMGSKQNWEQVLAITFTSGNASQTTAVSLKTPSQPCGRLVVVDDNVQVSTQISWRLPPRCKRKKDKKRKLQNYISTTMNTFAHNFPKITFMILFGNCSFFLLDFFFHFYRHCNYEYS